MFRTKRNFSLRESPSRLSPSLSNGTPCKRLRLNSTPLVTETPEKCNKETLESIETPPPTPAIKSESKIQALVRVKTDLEKEQRDYEEQIESIMNEIKAVREKTLILESKRYVVDDKIEIAKRSQVAVRDLLNEIYNPGNEIAQQASTLLEELVKNHSKKFDKISFELTNHLESSKAACSKKISELSHQIDLHQRTLITLEGVPSHTTKETIEIIDTSDALIPDGDRDSPTKQAEEVVKTEDCITIESQESQDQVTNDVVLEDDEETDIEEERAFTPCQAQKLQ